MKEAGMDMDSVKRSQTGTVSGRTRGYDNVGSRSKKTSGVGATATCKPNAKTNNPMVATASPEKRTHRSLCFTFVPMR